MAQRVRKNRQSSFRDPFRGNLELQISGHRVAGMLDFALSGASAGPESIPQKPWQTFLILARFAKRYSNPSAYVPATELALLLNAQGVLESAVSADATKLIYRLRRHLNQLGIAEVLVTTGYLSNAADFGKTLIQRKRNLGYRLALPHGNLTIDLDEDRHG